MDYTPIEIIKLIALYLKPGIMALVSKAFNIYDECWYHDYLLMRYHESEILDKEFSFKELCQRSLLEGDIYIFDPYVSEKKLGISGIKATPVGKNFGYIGENYILKFNGDLYRLNLNLKPTIIDHNVIDIGFNCYIKKAGLYIMDNKSGKIEFCVLDSTKSNFGYISYVSHNLYQFYTSNTIYFIYFDSFTKTTSICKFDMEFDIIKIFSTSRINNKIITYILTNNNELLIYFDKKLLSKPIIITNVADLGKNYVCINKKYYYFNAFESRFNFALSDLIPFDCAYENKQTNTKIVLYEHINRAKMLLQENNQIKIIDDICRIYLIKK